MATLTKINLSGESVGEVELSDALAAYPCNAELAHACVVAQLASRRSGTASTLTKGEVKGSGAKPWRQKGTGRARAGYRSSPIWRGGGVVFGPKPRSYGKRVSKRNRRTAFFGVLADKVRQGQVRVIDGWEMEAPRTKTIVALKNALDTGKLLCVCAADSRNACLSARNVPDVSFMEVGSVSIHDILYHTDLLISEPALRILEKRFKAVCGKAD